jgi:hypothetical protein
VRWFPRVLVLLVALATLGGAYVGHALSNDQSYELPVGSPAQREMVTRLVSSLVVPAGATRDLYASACGFPTGYCVVAPGTTRRALLEEVTRLLERRGARVVEPGCDGHACDVSACQRSFVVDGVGLVAVDGDCVERARPPGAARVGVVMAQPIAVLSAALDDRAAPLGSLTSLGLRDRHEGNTVCKARVAAGCMDLRVSYEAGGAVVPVTSGLRAELQRAGFWVDLVNCRPQRRGGMGCLVSARKFRVQGGREGVVAILRVKPLDAGRSSVDLRLSPYGWYGGAG